MSPIEFQEECRQHFAFLKDFDLTERTLAPNPYDKGYRIVFANDFLLVRIEGINYGANIDCRVGKIPTPTGENTDYPFGDYLQYYAPDEVLHGITSVIRLRGQQAQITAYAEAMQKYAQDLLSGDFSGWASVLREQAIRNITYLAWLAQIQPYDENTFPAGMALTWQEMEQHRLKNLAEFRAKVARERELYGDLSEESAN